MTRSTAHRIPPNVLAWALCLAYWRLYKRRAEQLALNLSEGK